MAGNAMTVKRSSGVKMKFNIKSRRKENRVAWVVVYIIMVALVAFTSLPIIYLVVTAFKPIDELFIYPPRFFVKNPTLENFSDLLRGLSSSEIPFIRYVFNSLFTTIVVVSGTVIISSMGAYGLTKQKIPFGNLLFNLILAALMFSPHVTRIPTYLVVNKLGILDTYWALIIPALAYPYNMFLMKQFIQQFPNELLESARIDGAKEFSVFLRILMPNIKPAWSTLIVLSFVLNWNDTIAALIYTQRQSMKVLPLAINLIAGQGLSRQGALMAATFIMTVPTILIFLLMQNNVLKTMVHSGIKA